MRPSAAMVRCGVEKNRMILFNLFDYKRGLALSNISDHKYSNKPPSPLQVTKGLKAKAGGGGFFSVSGKKRRTAPHPHAPLSFRHQEQPQPAHGHAGDLPEGQRLPIEQNAHRQQHAGQRDAGGQIARADLPSAGQNARILRYAP